MMNRPGDVFLSDSTKRCLSFPIELLYDYISFIGCKFLRKIEIFNKTDYIISKLNDNLVIADVYDILNKHNEPHIKKYAIIFLISLFYPAKDVFNFCLSFFTFKYKVKTIINTNVKHRWKIPTIARLLYVSEGTLKKRLSTEGTSFTKILTQCRMEYAVRELLMSDKNINQIAADCGYRSTSYFISLFSYCYGLSPHAYTCKHKHAPLPLNKLYSIR
ncbi:helix-turn-helix transcriptional regulator [Salmonella enterica]|nr:helix-turn-helix transcriptional regulator [Salmonella enterica]